jgi:hypothetical protein
MGFGSLGLEPNRTWLLSVFKGRIIIYQAVNILSFALKQSDVIREMSIGETFVSARDDLHISKCPSSQQLSLWIALEAPFQRWSTGPYSSVR